MKIVPSLNVLNISDLNKKIVALEGACNFFHLDIARKDFTDYEIGIQSAELERIRGDVSLEVHLMTRLSPLSVRAWCRGSVKRIIFHPSTCIAIPALIKMIRREKREPWIAVSQRDALVDVERYFGEVKGILVLDVPPGPSSQEKIPELFDFSVRLAEKYPSLNVALDGGIGWNDLNAIRSSRLEHVVIGNLIYSGGSPRENYRKLTEKLTTRN